MAHRKRDAVDDLIQRGATEAKSPKEIAQQSDIIHLCVTGSPQVEANIRGENGLLAGLRSHDVNPTFHPRHAGEFCCCPPLSTSPSTAFFSGGSGGGSPSRLSGPPTGGGRGHHGRRTCLRPG